jgi:peroxiredoxin/protein-disulfide isomerase
MKGTEMPRLLEPGIKAPPFVLPAANLDGDVCLEQDLGKKIVLVFFPSNWEDQLLSHLANFQERLPDLEDQGVVVLGVSNVATERLQELAKEKSISFPLLSDLKPAGAIAKKYGLLVEEGQLQAAVFIIDEDGLIRRVYEPAKYPHLPNPAMVLRAIKNLAGVPKPAPVSADDWQLGPPDAPMVLIEYADYECGPCREAYRTLKQVVPGYKHQLLWIHRHLPLRHSHPLAQGAAEAAEAAGAQGRFWDMHDRLFEAEGALEREQLIEYAREIGLDVERFTDDLDSRRFQGAVNADFKQAVRNKIKLPPALFINGLPLDGPRSQEAICARIERLLACV